jgi:single-stranded-DNA-specific exonuclease
MINHFELYMEKSYRNLNKNKNNNNIFNYDSKISSIAFNKNFYKDISRLEPFGNGNPEPIFLFEKLKIIKKDIIKKKHISCIMKSKIDYSIRSISFNSINTKIGEYLLNYKKEINVVGQIKENIWNNKNTLQLTIKDLII